MSDPELISYSFGGRHNEWMALSTQRVKKSAAWKRQRVVVVLPASETMSTRVALAHWNLIFPPNQGVVRILALGQEVGHAYNNAIEQALEHPDFGGWEYLLTIEHDNAPPPDGVLRLIERMDVHPEFAAISGLYWTKGQEGMHQIWGDVNDPVVNYRPQPPRPGELVECYGIGMGFALWRLQMFRDPKLRKPWFQTRAGVEGTGTQDLFYWADARKHGYRCAVDCGVLVGHWDQATETMW
jgi:hypothetical protein